MTLFIDTREKKEDLIAAVVNRCNDLGEAFEFRENTVGDFIFDDRICIEHKSTEDFHSSLHTGHLDSQMADIKQYPIHALVIEGRWKYNWDPKTHNYGNFGPRHKNGKIASYMFSETWKVPVVQVDNAGEFADMLFMIRDQVDDLDTLVVPDLITRHTRTANAGDHILNLYLSIRGLALKKARALKEKYPNPADFLYAYKATGLPEMDWMTLNKTSRTALNEICAVEWPITPPKKSKAKKKTTAVA